jgi:hypothetical protein
MRKIKGQRKGLSIFNIGTKEYYKLYDTVIAIRESQHDGSHRIRLNHNGFKTNHTKNCMNDFLSMFGFKVYQKDFVWYVKGREISFQFETDMVYFNAVPNNDSWVIGRYIEEKWKPYTRKNWDETFNHEQYSSTMK